MTSDRELLELAAKAAGIELANQPFLHTRQSGDALRNDGIYWNPLTDDGDALRLAVKLNIDIRFYPESEICEPWVETAADKGDADELLMPDPDAATRRAIVRAAAEIGRSME